jgi:hypothetical protein
MDNIHAIRYLKSFRFVCSSEVLLLFFLRFEDRITHILFISSIIAIEEKLKELTRLLQNSTGEVESEGELDERVEANFEMHQSLAQICRTQRQPAKRVEKMLEKQFAPYKNEFERLDAQKISAIIEGRTENTVTNRNSHNPPHHRQTFCTVSSRAHSPPSVGVLAPRLL